MTLYRFRLRFRLVTGLDVPNNISAFCVPSLVQSGEVASNNPKSPGVDQWITFKSPTYDSAEEAAAVAQYMKDAILLAGAEGLGADLGIDRATGQLSDTVKEDIKAKFGTIIRDNVHGIDVYEDGDVQYMDVQAYATVHTELDRFATALEQVCSLPKLNVVTRTGAELINDSLFPMPDEARFLLRISAIEALCEQGQRSQDVQDVISELLKAADELPSDQEAVDEIRRVLKEARRQSVRQACLAKIRLRLGMSAGKEFDRLYVLRSKYVHEGAGRASLSTLAAEALKLARDLLFEEVKAAG